jgi:hypothetical protein
MSSRQAYPAVDHRRAGFACEGCNRSRGRLRLTWWRGERDDKRERLRREGIRLHGGVTEVQQTRLVLFCRSCRKLARR